LVFLHCFRSFIAAAGGARTPAKLADLDRHQALFPRGHAAVKSGEVVVLWSVPLKGEGEAAKDDAIVAYQKNAPVEGGSVLLSSGAIKKIVAAEFAAMKGLKK
jgi:hypothetical protein